MREKNKEEEEKKGGGASCCVAGEGDFAVEDENKINNKKNRGGSVCCVFFLYMRSPSKVGAGWNSCGWYGGVTINIIDGSSSSSIHSSRSTNRIHSRRSSTTAVIVLTAVMVGYLLCYGAP